MSRGDSCLIKHKELVGQIVFPGTQPGIMPILSFKINPGRVVFPWLSSQARSWERYKFRSLRFVFHPAVGTQTAGNMFYSFDFDVSDSKPTTPQAMLQNRRSGQSPIWRQLTIAPSISELHPGGKEFFVYTGGETVTPTNVDVGTLHLATDITQAAGTNPSLGYLFVEYDLELRIQQPNSIVPKLSSCLMNSKDCVDSTSCNSGVAANYTLCGVCTLNNGKPGIRIGNVTNATVPPQIVHTQQAVNTSSFFLNSGNGATFATDYTPAVDWPKTVVPSAPDRTLSESIGHVSFNTQISDVLPTAVSTLAQIVDEDGHYEVSFSGSFPLSPASFQPHLIDYQTSAAVTDLGTALSVLANFDVVIEALDDATGTVTEYKFPNQLASIPLQPVQATAAEMDTYFKTDGANLGIVPRRPHSEAGFSMGAAVPVALAGTIGALALYHVRFSGMSFPDSALQFSRGTQLLLKLVPRVLTALANPGTDYTTTAANPWISTFTNGLIPAATGVVSPAISTTVNNAIGLVLKLNKALNDVVQSN